jgi:hypothetical protein
MGPLSGPNLFLKFKIYLSPVDPTSLELGVDSQRTHAPAYSSFGCGTVSPFSLWGLDPHSLPPQEEGGPFGEIWGIQREQIGG